MNKGYLKFLKKSKNQHGVHSPFVFCLLTKGLYPKDRRWKGKRWRVRKKNVFLARLVAYFQPTSVFVSRDKSIVYQSDLSAINTHFVDFGEINKPVDFILIDENVAVSELSNYIELMHNGSVLILDRRQKQVETKELWNAIILNEEITVSIDFYSFGVAFVRKEQLKQHFTLRM